MGGIGIGLSPAIQQGSVLSLPAWTNLPLFALPSVVYLTVGKAYTIYGDSLINVPISNNLAVDYTCNIGAQSGTKDFAVTPITGNIGTHTLTAVFKQGGKVFTTQTINIKVVADSTGVASTVLMVGDSLVYLGSTDIGGAISTALITDPTFIGTQGTTIKNEGASGKAYETMLTSGSPFYISGAFNISAYFANNSLATPDFVHIRFGVNDMFLPGTYNMSDAYMKDHVIDKAKTLIDAFLAYDANLKIIIGLPTICENSGAGWNANYDEVTYPQDHYIENIHRMQGALVTAFDNNAYSPRVFMSNEVIFVDRNDDYPKTAEVHTNGVHPAPSGDQHIGLGIAATLNYQNSLIPTGLTLSLISGGVKIDWNDNSGGAFETELWGKSDSGTYALLYTIAAGTITKNDLLDAVDLRYYKIRGKNGTYFTQFTAEQSIAMLGSNVVVNGDFASWSGDNPTSWTITESSPNLVTESTGKCRIVSDGTAVQMVTSGILENGSKYRFKINIVTVTAGSIRVKYSSLKNVVQSTTGQKVWYDTTDGTQIIISRYSGATDVIFDDVVAQKVLMP